MADDSEYHYSITVLVEDLPVLYCLRGLSMYAQETGNVYKPWKKAGHEEWDRNRIVRFHFTCPEYRRCFEATATELLGGRWTKVGTSDDDPLPPD
jgi:hypothetical protein